MDDAATVTGIDERLGPSPDSLVAGSESPSSVLTGTFQTPRTTASVYEGVAEVTDLLENPNTDFMEQFEATQDFGQLSDGSRRISYGTYTEVPETLPREEFWTEMQSGEARPSEKLTQADFENDLAQNPRRITENFQRGSNFNGEVPEAYVNKRGTVKFEGIPIEGGYFEISPGGKEFKMGGNLFSFGTERALPIGACENGVYSLQEGAWKTSYDSANSWASKMVKSSINKIAKFQPETVEMDVVVDNSGKPVGIRTYLKGRFDMPVWRVRNGQVVQVATWSEFYPIEWDIPADSSAPPNLPFDPLVDSDPKPSSDGDSFITCDSPDIRDEDFVTPRSSLDGGEPSSPCTSTRRVRGQWPRQLPGLSCWAELADETRLAALTREEYEVLDSQYAGTGLRYTDNGLKESQFSGPVPKEYVHLDGQGDGKKFPLDPHGLPFDNVDIMFTQEQDQQFARVLFEKKLLSKSYKTELKMPIGHAQHGRLQIPTAVWKENFGRYAKVIANLQYFGASAKFDLLDVIPEFVFTDEGEPMGLRVFLKGTSYRKPIYRAFGDQIFQVKFYSEFYGRV
uniref:Uncharacterized protein n=1 Tax=Mucochytrium quahogii TaxID=96639 RepID=A0A7S2SP69_9STRA